MRLKSLDAARGLLMLYITVMVHGAFWLRIMPDDVGAALLFEMPMIFIISGMAYGMAERHGGANGIRTAGEYGRFLLARLSRILIPYWVYAGVCALLVFAWAHQQSSNAPAHALSDLLWAWLNPVNHGKDHDVGMLAWHLWFVPTFVWVTAMMPWVSRLPDWNRASLLGVALLTFCVSWGLSKLQFEGAPLLKSVLFYLVFALLGLQVARQPALFRSVPWPGVAAVCLAVLLAFWLFSGNPKVLLMQGNKFPPNHVFFVFACLWTAVFMTLAFKVPAVITGLDRLNGAFWLKPFIDSGYSIYLWQGLAYSLAVTAAKHTHLPPVGNLVLALLLSVALGRLAAPVERWRITGLGR